MIGRVKERKSVRGDRGFTLIELMVVVGLLVICGLLATKFDTGSWMANYRLRGAARELNSAMQKVRMSAVKDDITYSILFDTSNGTYEMQKADGAGGWLPVVGSVVTLSNYKGGIAYGAGSANKDVLGGSGAPSSVTFASDGGSTVKFRATFTPKGFSNGGVCYLKNDRNGVYAVWALASGAMRIRKWNGSGFVN